MLLKWHIKHLTKQKKLQGDVSESAKKLAGDTMEATKDVRADATEMAHQAFDKAKKLLVQ